MSDYIYAEQTTPAAGALFSCPYDSNIESPD
jgi:hypothetical protein